MTITPNEFYAVCDAARPAKDFFCSLYQTVPFFGGPEEGGWCGHDNVLVAFQRFPTEEAANAAREAMKAMVDHANDESKKADDAHMAHSMDWLEERGLDADFLSEPSGPSQYHVMVESHAGSHVSVGDRHYS